MIRNNLKKIAIGLVLFAALVYLGACAYLYSRQDLILFPARKTPIEEKFSFPIPFEEIWIDSDDAKLHGLYFHVKNPKGVIIFFHGNTERAQQFGKSAREFTEQDFDYFVLDYRGYGKSSGKITSEKQFLADIDKIYEWVNKKYPENKIAVAGRSMGAVASTYLGAKHNLRATVLIAPFYNVAAMKDIRYPYLPDFLLKYHFENNEWIKQIKGPVFIIHGTKDKTIPYVQSERLADAAPRAQRRYFSVPGAGHSDLQDFPLYHKILYYLMNHSE